ncbi:D-lyxose/D-mannose family sugar isomerase [Mucilaginibacter myungsuensis]|uniref:D-lyxose ketol-isomerase n=1 Tax=Mucilaginibacter myungsuensis TaxID=649104 RepID=A0A929KSM7_9SPHI|nr:D-lyxose/D-mannose family sugar isomerase [Mucilaginibacter myungsuensis]MBE9660789.1 D-lyxose/D-mannose family sugar isomerase [Mucilaginibacter myungsuensis]MDN3600835.1 D-lyxose/D-mannose family sugar isomerase [Mucilaginibacter myungsuensis]
MRRSEINNAIIASRAFFEQHGWALPPEPKWDVTDFGLGDFKKTGLILINLAEEPEYCEKLMYAAKGQTTPSHTHKKKKEDIICRTGILQIKLWAEDPAKVESTDIIKLKINGKYTDITSGTEVSLLAGERVTIESGVWHEFYPASDECIIGEVSTANDDLNDNFFSNPDIGRYAEIDEDEAPIVKLLSDK